jgi:hypothetical protein
LKERFRSTNNGFCAIHSDVTSLAVKATFSSEIDIEIERGKGKAFFVLQDRLKIARSVATSYILLQACMLDSENDPFSFKIDG